MCPNRRELLALSAATAAAGIAGCVGTDDLTPVAREDAPFDDWTGDDDYPDLDPETETDVDHEDLERLVRGNVAFALELHRTLVEHEDEANVFASPYSISVALAMTWAGARGETADAMADALGFDLGQDALHPAFGALDAEIDARGSGGGDGDGNGEDGGDTDDGEDGGDTDDGERDGNTDDEFRLNVANALWGQEGFPFEESFLETVGAHYGGDLRERDFQDDAEAAREEINEWVAGETEDRIEELLPERSLDRYTRLVLTNAIYFYGAWTSTFDDVGHREFTALDGSTASVEFVGDERTFAYAADGDHQAVELPYEGGDVSMVIVLPEAGSFGAVEEALSVDVIAGLLDDLERTPGRLEFPRFGFESSFGLRDVLSELGMGVAFESGAADFTGMYDESETGEELFVHDVYHDSFVDVDEEGTEAAAATGVVVGTESAPPKPEFELVVDRPFLFFVRDRRTETILFLGRVGDAADAQ